MKKGFFLFWTILLALFCACREKQLLSERAIINGKFIGVNQDKQNATKLFLPNLISGETVEYVINPKENGAFTISVPLFNSLYGIIMNEEIGIAIALFLSPGQDNEIKILGNEGKPQIKITKGKGLTMEELQQMGMINQSLLEIIRDGHNSPHLELTLSPYAYGDSIMVKMENDLSIVKNDPEISEELKQIMRTDLKFFYLNYDLLNYEKNMKLLSMNLKNKELIKENFIPQKPDRQYYSLLKDFDLNRLPYYNFLYYSMTLQSILANKTINIPSIEDKPIVEWQREVKAQLADLIGFKEGIFYDLLTAKAYFIQIKSELKPLSNKQKENIRVYFNRSYIDFLFTENEKIIKGLEPEKNISSLKKVTPPVSKEALMETIIYEYKGKVVLIDFWATWCGPCLGAISQFKSLKSELSDKNIVFVYITNPSSNIHTWEKLIPTIGGEHYYLTEEEWIYLTEKFKIKGIPYYLLYDSKGVLKNTITTGYPGNEIMRKMIEELL